MKSIIELYWDILLKNKSTDFAVNDLMNLILWTNVLSIKLSGRVISFDSLMTSEDIEFIKNLKINSDTRIAFLKMLIDNRSFDSYSSCVDKFHFTNKELHKNKNILEQGFNSLGLYAKKYYSVLSSKNSNFHMDFKSNSYIELNQVENRDDIDNFKYSSCSEVMESRSLNKSKICHVISELGHISLSSAIFSSGRIKGYNSYQSKKRYVERNNVAQTAVYWSKLLEDSGNSSKNENIFIDLSLGCINTKMSIVPLIKEIKSRGDSFRSIGLLSSINIGEVPNFIDKSNKSLSNAIFNNSSPSYNNVKIDLSKKEIIYRDVNIYHGFHERITCTLRAYDYDYDSKYVNNIVKVHLKMAVILLRYIDELFSHIENDFGKKIKLIVANSHLAPFSAVKDYILHRNVSCIEVIGIGAAYENYYSNFGTNLAKKIGIVNYSKNPNIRAPFLPERERFLSWLVKNKDNTGIISRVNELVQKNRNFSDKVSDNAFKSQLISLKKQGKKIVCCWGKIVFDSGVPYDGGPAHSDFKDWLNHTVKIAQENYDDIVVLIKPHPHEMKVEITMKISQYLRDLLPEKLPENVYFLEHDAFNTFELVDIIDEAILWNGTSSMELTALGVPVMMCGYFGMYDYHMDLIYPSSRDDYKNKLLSKSNKVISDELKYQAMAYTYYMGSEEVAIPCHYSRRQLLNDPVGTPIWYSERLYKLINNDDPYLKYALDKCL